MATPSRYGMVASLMRFTLKTLIAIFLLLSVAVGLCVRVYIQKRNEARAFELIAIAQDITVEAFPKMIPDEPNLDQASSSFADDKELKLIWHLVDSKEKIGLLDLSFTVEIESASVLHVHASGNERISLFLKEIRQELEKQKHTFTWDVTIDGKPLLKETK